MERDIELNAEVDYYTGMTYNALAVIYILLSYVSIEYAQEVLIVPPLCMILGQYYLYISGH